MKKYIKAKTYDFIEDYVEGNEYAYANFDQMRQAEKLMREFLEVVDEMDELTYRLFEQNWVSDVYGAVSENVASLNHSGILKADKDYNISKADRGR